MRWINSRLRTIRSAISNVIRSDRLRRRPVTGHSDMIVEYAFERVSIKIPSSHQLGLYQRKHKLYDRFLPHLAKYLPVGALVVDVGANCGDTLAAMFSSNSNLAFVCVEPDDEFYALLDVNTKRIQEIDARVSVRLIKSLIGKSVTNVSLVGTGGTKKAVVGGMEGAATMDSTALDGLLDYTEKQRLVLIKSDVDGYDYDVVDSAEHLVNEHTPLLFFECQFDHDFQKAGYEQTISRLGASGYDYWVLFDNFGEVVLRTQQVNDIYQLFDYVWRQNMKRTSRTIFYFDVLATGARYRSVVDHSVGDYLVVS